MLAIKRKQKFRANTQTGNSLNVHRGQALPPFGVHGVNHHVGHVTEMSRFNARRSGCCSNEEIGATPRGRTSPVFGLPKHRTGVERLVCMGGERSKKVMSMRLD